MTTLTPRTAPLRAAQVDDAAMREVLSSFCTGVAVITATQPDGRPAGMAVQSFSSVSLDPPLVCFCPARTSTTWPKIRSAGRFAVNLLAADQQRLCRQFAVTGGDKFAGADWHPGTNGAPLLDGALATIECELAGTLPGGDHLIALGRVTALAAADRPRTADPLLYFRRTYGRLRSGSSTSAGIASARPRSEA
ncbi:flavin reductase family protein [Streptomyces sp. TRM S81-3]|uniref:Flavin reductase family protein n=1 Tax=Streptomyces griseicoloratus TaxID=2752516 RepID=A0A926L079_9ACTN|nr:flavin reductase family protein [Streptomyces griseicoloratus]MBD0417843.1 flavin reductase family protein [Streptomyces griseicoloratus]